MVRTQNKKKSDHRQLRVQRRETIATAKRNGWTFISKKKHSYNLPHETRDHIPATLSFRGTGISRSDIFFKMMSISFLNAILATIDSATWMLQQGKFFQPTFCMLYKYLAIYIRIQGLYNVPVECRRSQRPLRTSIDEARKHFQLMHPDDCSPNNKVLEKLFTHFLISHSSLEDCLHFSRVS